MSKWSEEFNKLPYEVRHIVAMGEIELRIQHLEFEKARLAKRYRASLKEINAHINNLKRDLKDKVEP